jgi:hypothetical protein
VQRKAACLHTPMEVLKRVWSYPQYLRQLLRHATLLCLTVIDSASMDL